jgi:hypothetical protein
MYSALVFVTVACLVGSTYNYLMQYMPEYAETICGVKYELKIKFIQHFRTVL